MLAEIGQGNATALNLTIFMTYLDECPRGKGSLGPPARSGDRDRTAQLGFEGGTLDGGLEKERSDSWPE